MYEGTKRRERYIHVSVCEQSVATKLPTSHVYNCQAVSCVFHHICSVFAMTRLYLYMCILIETRETIYDSFVKIIL